MPTCNILDFSLIQEYYSENVSDPNNPKSSATNLCCYESLPMSYDTFVSGISHLYNSSCLRDREFSDYVTQLFTDCLSGSTGGVTKIIAGTNITISPTSGLGDVTINSSGSGGGYWTGNTDGTISNSGLTSSNVGIGTHVPSEMLSVSGNTNITNNLFVSGDTFYEGALSGTGNITTVNNITAGGSVSARGLTSTQYLNVSGNTFYEGTLSGTGTITTTDTITGLNISMKGAVGDGVVQLLPSEDQSADVQLTIPILSGNDEIVTRTGSETLTNKTLTTPSIAMGTNKITGLGDPTAAQDAVTRNYLTSTTASTYAYQYISFFSAAAGANLDGGNWVLPSAGGGISNHTWNNDSGYAGTNDSPGDGPFNAAQSDTHIAIPVPVDGFLVGFTCNCRNNGSASSPRNAGLFVGTPDWGTTNSTPFYLRAFGAGDDEGGAANSKPYKIDGMLGSGSTVPFAVSKDMQVLPAMCAYDTDNVAAQCTWTVVFKTAVSGTT